MSEEIEQPKDYLKVFQMATAQVPIIEENLIVNTRTPWVYYGIANQAPQELIRLYNSSPTHRAAITSKWYGVRGEELIVTEQDKPRTLMINSLGDSLYDLWNKISLDFILYGGFSVNCVWSKDREYFEMYYMDYSKLRAAKCDMYDKIHHYYYSADWAFPKKFIPRKLSGFDPANEEDFSQVFIHNTHSAGNNYYPTPSYWGGATSVSCEVEIYNWWFNNICNGLQPSLFVSLMGTPPPEEREQIYNSLVMKYAGSGNSGKLFLTFADSQEMAPTITQIQPNSSDKQFIEMAAAVQQAILTSHQISSPELLGIITPGGLGTPDHLEAANHFLNLVVKPIQTELLTVLTKLLSLRDKVGIDIKVKQFEIVTRPDTAPVRISDTTTTKDITENKDVVDTTNNELKPNPNE